MKKVRFIYNPYSGENIILSKIDTVIEIHQKNGYEVVPYRINKDETIDEALKSIDDTYEYILIAGGDGTVDSLVNAMKRNNIDLPVGILPVGTANDFATYVGISSDVKEACEQIISSKPIPVDIGKINDKYFINVASSGLFTDVSQKTDINLKNTIGKLAYYLKGLEELPNFRKLKVKVKSKQVNYDGTMYLVLVFNGQTAGSFRLATRADVTDGMLDVILIKAIPIRNILPLFVKILKGDHLDSDQVIYFKTDDVLIECEEDIVTDIDGERGPDFPLSLKCIKGGLKLKGLKK